MTRAIPIIIALLASPVMAEQPHLVAGLDAAAVWTDSGLSESRFEAAVDVLLKLPDHQRDSLVAVERGRVQLIQRLRQQLEDDEIRNRDRARVARILRSLQNVKAPFSPPEDHSILDVNLGWADKGRFIVRQVIDEQNMLVQPWVVGGSDDWYWITGHSTEGIADGDLTQSKLLLWRSGTRQYASFGGQRTVRELTVIRLPDPVDDDVLALASAIARLQSGQDD